ncbi:Protein DETOXIFICATION 29 [Dionaea muscipula]
MAMIKSRAVDFFREFFSESRKLWYIAGPAIFTSICQYSLTAITQTISGHVGTMEQAAVSMQNTVFNGFTYGILSGMGSALETLCGQAYGAGQLDMLGIYMQRSWVILVTTALFCSLFYVFAGKLLMLIGQTEAISVATGKFSILMLPQLFAYAMNFPMVKFLQAQSKVMVISWISAVALVLHTFFSWLLMLKLRWGLVAAAVVLNASWWFIVVAQLVYILSGTCGRAWTGLSWAAFQNLLGFLKLSLASAVMNCLELWYYSLVFLLAGYMKNAEVTVNGMSICLNILGWAIMTALGFQLAVSVRVSNELGATNARGAKFSVLGAVSNSFIIGLVLSMFLIIFHKSYPWLFTDNTGVVELVYQLTPLLALSIVINNVQPVLSGVAVGAGWQARIAYVNVGCYYVLGVPFGLVLGYKLGFGVKGFWYGMMAGTVVQTIILVGVVCKSNWNKEASKAMDRIRKWGGPQDVMQQ